MHRLSRRELWGCGRTFAGRRRGGDAAGALAIFREMSKVGVVPGERTIVSTMEAFAARGDAQQVLALLEVRARGASAGGVGAKLSPGHEGDVSEPVLVCSWEMVLVAFAPSSLSFPEGICLPSPP